MREGSFGNDRKPCRLGYEEHGGERYCFEHYGFAHHLMWGTLLCDRNPAFNLTRRGGV